MSTNLTNSPALVGHTTAKRVWPHPALVDWLGGELVARIGRQPNEVGVVIDTGMHRIGGEQQQVARRVFGR